MGRIHTVAATVVGQQRINCAGCEQRITIAIRRLPGILDVRPSARTQQIVVRLDADQVSAGQVWARLEQLGYEIEARAG